MTALKIRDAALSVDTDKIGVALDLSSHMSPVVSLVMWKQISKEVTFPVCQVVITLGNRLARDVDVELRNACKRTSV
jgi:hypothetical protein